MFSFWTLAVETANKIARSTAEVFSDLYREFMPKVYRYVSYRIVDVPTAEDLTSVIFEKALTRFKTYSSEKAGFSTWLFSIARNTVTDYFRARGKVQLVPVEDAPGSGEEPSAEDDLVKSEEKRALHFCLARLGAQEQEILSLKFGAEMTNREIARVTGLTESNVGVIVYRSVRRLKEDFSREMG